MLGGGSERTYKLGGIEHCETSQEIVALFGRSVCAVGLISWSSICRLRL